MAGAVDFLSLLNFSKADRKKIEEVNENEIMVQYFVKLYLAECEIEYPISSRLPSEIPECCTAMRDLVAKMEAKEWDVLDNLTNMIQLCDWFNMDDLFEIGKSLFADGITWFKIVALFAFIGHLILTAKRNKDLHYTLPTFIAGCLEWYCDDELKKWMESNGGWKYLIHLNSNLMWEKGTKWLEKVM